MARGPSIGPTIPGLMCGFAGIVVWDEKFRVSRQTLERMSARVAHRGPDGQGLYLSPESPITPDRPQVGLAHRRLAILDLDPRANQPFSDAEGRWIVFNGEIYNFRELRSELSKLKPEYIWRTQCDTEVLLVAYDVWGSQCVEHLNGMFAFAVWDQPARSLFLARDRMGQKPLYIAVPYCSPTLTSIAFASELSALRPLSWFRADIEPLALCNYLRWGCIGNESTIYVGAEKLAPGMWRRFGAGRAEGAHYFSPNQSSGGRNDPVATTRELIQTAVRRQLVSDVPVGCFLSGGMDSSIIGAAAQAAAPAGCPVFSFSIGFEDPRYDETRYAGAVARHLGMKHQAFHVRPDAAEDLPKLAEVFGEPFADSSALPTHYLSRETRAHVKVALSGDGGDELFGGYDRYRAMNIARSLQWVPRPIVHMLSDASTRWLPGTHPKSTGLRAKRFLSALALPSAKRYAAYSRLFDNAAITSLASTTLQCGPDVVEARYESLLHEIDPVRAALAVDRLTYLPDDLLTKVDRASMLHALEVRSPFMDHELVEFAAGLTADQLLRGGPKRMLREAFAGDLPAWVFKREKMGFAVPIGQWFRGELRPMLRDHLFAANSFASAHFNRKVVERMVDEHEQNRVDHSQRLYALLMLELWWRIEKR
jgi:asparagine synthase (glutamine-hydrolysing)